MSWAGQIVEHLARMSVEKAASSGNFGKISTAAFLGAHAVVFAGETAVGKLAGDLGMYLTNATGNVWTPRQFVIAADDTSSCNLSFAFLPLRALDHRANVTVTLNITKGDIGDPPGIWP